MDEPNRRPNRLDRLAKAFFSTAASVVAQALLGAYGRFESEPSAEPTIYFANHASHADTLVIWAAMPRFLRPECRVVAAGDYWGGSWIKRKIALLAFNAVFVERGGASGPEAASARLEPLRRALRAGHSIVVFPEGTRGSGELPGPFKTGLFHLSREFPTVRLVPVYVENSHRAMPKGVWYPVPFACSARFGRPLDAVEGETRDAFLDRARQSVCALARGVSQ